VSVVFLIKQDLLVKNSSCVHGPIKLAFSSSEQTPMCTHLWRQWAAVTTACSEITAALHSALWLEFNNTRACHGNSPNPASVSLKPCLDTYGIRDSHSHQIQATANSNWDSNTLLSTFDDI